jgi:hypothetical protein
MRRSDPLVFDESCLGIDPVAVIVTNLARRQLLELPMPKGVSDTGGRKTR